MTPKRSLTERSTVFWLLLALPVIAGCLLAIVQSDALAYVTESRVELFDGLIDQANQQLQRVRRS